ncbi:MAG: NAD(P)-dependent oxidoreductase [Reyranella sp.]|uniref:NAD(P)-dependent oxidoreductase n=1 Tax=Reyranella sp. TaxID=1929291 RepID=UPI00121B38FC|nr:NAD(P)-dependent oxidoreductase [Reyranella sp.]TAJ37309.1 MAG: NAD(P)-dependent oxidoreductase [Reyranella sp.]
MSSKASHSIGWIGLGRMGEAMAARLVKAGHGVSVWNRTASKADPLAQIGAEVVTDKTAMAHCATVFTMVSTTDDLKDILFGPGGVIGGGVLSGNARPQRIVDMSSISDTGSAEIRKRLTEAGVAYLSAPVSGNAKVAKAGKLLVVASGPKAEYDAVEPLLSALGRSAMYVGEGELSRIWKIAHNTMFGVIIQSLCEITLLAEKAGIPRHVFLESINQSVLGSMYTRYKTPALVNLDFTTTFTPKLLLKDMELGMGAAKSFGVMMPTASVTRDSVLALSHQYPGDVDFSVLLLELARAAGMKLEPENVKVSDGLA